MECFGNGMHRKWNSNKAIRRQLFPGSQEEGRLGQEDTVPVRRGSSKRSTGSRGEGQQQHPEPAFNVRTFPSCTHRSGIISECRRRLGDVGNCTVAGTDEQGTADLQKVHAGSAAVLQKAQNVEAKRSSSREPGRRNQVPINGWSPFRRFCTRQEAEFL
ncbi:hypothetical protein XELAEV_18022509mg [Xenopus laevis]|uniref:Uncharacterized protein n=1 Tax=Xenopus laevis TaxID=8355 RepID=A0A974D3B8_XENLA|nr:hypothetical protein XELAEV_18022509mg [Xenopus laevis]